MKRNFAVLQSICFLNAIDYLCIELYQPLLNYLNFFIFISVNIKNTVMEISISQILRSNSAIFHNEGLQIYYILEPNIMKGQTIVLSFESVENCSTQFLNACIGKLYIKFDKAKLESLLTYKIPETLTFVERKLKEVIENALEYEFYDELIDNVIASH